MSYIFRDSLEILMDIFYKEVEKVTDLVLRVSRKANGNLFTAHALIDQC